MTTYQLIVTGLMISGFTLGAIGLNNKIAARTSFERFDPTLFLRLWQRIYDQFGRFGDAVVSKNLSPIVNITLYHWTVGIVATAMSMCAYMFGSITLLGTALVAHQSGAVINNLSAKIEFLAGFCVLFAFAIMLYSSEEDIEPV